MIAELQSTAPVCRLLRGEEVVAGSRTEAAVDRIIEMAVRFADLGLQPGDALHFFAELHSGGGSLDRAPREGTIDMTVPSTDFERVMWQV